MLGFVSREGFRRRSRDFQVCFLREREAFDVVCPPRRERYNEQVNPYCAVCSGASRRDRNTGVRPLKLFEWGSAGSPILKILSPLSPSPPPPKTPPGVVNGRGMRLLDVIGEVLHLGGQLLVSYVLVGLAYGWTLSSKAVQKYIPDDKVRKSCKTHVLNSIFAHVVFIVLSLY